MREIEKKNSASELIAMEQRDAEYGKMAMWHDIKKKNTEAEPAANMHAKEEEEKLGFV